MTAIIDYLSWRKKHGMTQAQAASVFCLDQGCWANYEKRQPKNLTLRKVHSIILKMYDMGLWNECMSMADYIEPSDLAPFRSCATRISSEMWEAMEAGIEPIPMRIRIIVASVKAARNLRPVPQLQKVHDPVIVEQPASREPAKKTSIEHQFKMSDVRTKIINEKVWFCLVDVCKAIDYANPASALDLIVGDRVPKRGGVDGVLKLMDVDSLGRSKEINFINEPNLYRLLTQCKLPKATIFEEWIYNEVIPSVCNTGSYSIHSTETSEEKLARLMGIRSEQVIAEARSYTDQRIQQIESRNYATLDQVKQISDGAAKRVLDDANKWAKEFEKEEKRCAGLRHEQLMSAGINSTSLTDILIKEIRTPIKERIYPLHGLGRNDQLARNKYTDADRVIAQEELSSFKFRYGLHGWNILEGGQA